MSCNAVLDVYELLNLRGGRIELSSGIFDLMNC